MICEFNAGTEHWYIDTDTKYVKIVNKEDDRVIKETHTLGLLGQLEGRRIAAYEGTYAMIGVSSEVRTDHFFLDPTQENKIIWSEADTTI
jgi:hypothetical protein